MLSSCSTISKLKMVMEKSWNSWKVMEFDFENCVGTLCKRIFCHHFQMNSLSFAETSHFLIIFSSCPQKTSAQNRKNWPPFVRTVDTLWILKNSKFCTKNVDIRIWTRVQSIRSVVYPGRFACCIFGQGS